MAERLRRSIVPSTIIRLSQVDRPARIREAARRAVGGRGRVELFFAFDDPCSAVALIDLERRLRDRAADLVALPVVRRGIADDPAVAAKRSYAVADARRLAARTGLELSRDEPIPAGDLAFLAEWVAHAEPAPAVTAFCVAAARRLWFEDVSTEREAFEWMWRGLVGGDPEGDEEAVGANEGLMARRGPYDTPAAVVAGQWFFAHDRLAQIAERLDDLGWRAAS